MHPGKTGFDKFLKTLTYRGKKSLIDCFKNDKRVVKYDLDWKVCKLLLAKATCILLFAKKGQNPRLNVQSGLPITGWAVLYSMENYDDGVGMMLCAPGIDDRVISAASVEVSRQRKAVLYLEASQKLTKMYHRNHHFDVCESPTKGGCFLLSREVCAKAEGTTEGTAGTTCDGANKLKKLSPIREDRSIDVLSPLSPIVPLGTSLDMNLKETEVYKRTETLMQQTQDLFDRAGTTSFN